jgi:hypothetical protein
MRRHKTAALVILILSIANSVLAAPALLEIHEARDDVIVRAPEDVGAVAMNPDHSFGMPYLIEEPEGRPVVDSDDEGYESASDEPTDDLSESASDEPTDDLSESGESPDRSPTSTEPLVQPQPAPSREVSTRPQPAPSRVISTRPKIMTPEVIKAGKISLIAGIFAAAGLGLLAINTSLNNTSAS